MIAAGIKNHGTMKATTACCQIRSTILAAKTYHSSNQTSTVGNDRGKGAIKRRVYGFDVYRLSNLRDRNFDLPLEKRFRILPTGVTVKNRMVPKDVNHVPENC